MKIIMENPSRYLVGKDFKHKSAILNCYKFARVIVPDTEPPNTGWPVCYLLHAFGGNRFSWLKVIQSLLHLVDQWILVFPESGRRWFINDYSGKHYEDYFIQELLPAIENHFPASILPEKRMIGGFSMGGASSLFFTIKYPHLFKITGSFAGAFYASKRSGDPYQPLRNTDYLMMPTDEEHCRVWGPENSLVRQMYDPEKLVEQATLTSEHTIFCEIGNKDYGRMIDMNRSMHALLLEKKIMHDYAEYEGDHSWNYAKEALQRTLLKLKKQKTFLFSNSE